VEVILATHRIMREYKLGSRLPYADLGFFLAHCNKSIPFIGIGDDAMKHEVERALDELEIYDMWKNAPVGMTSKVQPINKQEFLLLINHTKNTLDQVSSKYDAHTHAVGLEYTAAKNELMRRYGNTVDAATLHRFLEQEASVKSASGELSKKLSLARESAGNYLKLYE